MRRNVVVLCVAVLALAGAGAAAAGWSSSSTVTGQSKAVSMPAGSTPAATIDAYPNLAVSWSAVTVSGIPVSSYTIRRYSEIGALQTITAGCSGAVAATTCTENDVPAGRWQYTSQPVKASWTGAESSKSATHEIAAPPAAVSCSNCTTFGSTSYVNAAGKLSVNIHVALPASSLSADTVNLTLTQGATTLTPGAQPATAGAGTLNFDGLNTASFSDGAITLTAWVTTNTSESSSNTTATVTRDVVVPAATNINGTNGGTTAKLDAGDTLVYTFSEPMAPASIIAGWDGSSRAATATFAPGTTSDTVTIGGAALGTVQTQALYVTVSTATCPGSLVLSGSKVTFTVTSCSGGTISTLLLGAGNSAFMWTPSTSATDQAANPMSSTPATETGGSQPNF